MSNKRRRRSVEEQAQWLFRRQRNANMLATPGDSDCIVVLDQVKSDFNIGKIFRSADAFGVREVHLIGIDFFDPSPAKGSFKWVPAKFHNHFSRCFEELSARGYTLFVLEPEAGELLTDVAFPRLSAFVVGHEEYGISFERADFPGLRGLRIPQVGRVQSLNVSVAASVVMYEYARQYMPQPVRAASEDALG